MSAHTPQTLHECSQCHPTFLTFCPLHAAAPALLEALEDAIRTWDAYGSASKVKARAAIAQAKGETK